MPPPPKPGRRSPRPLGARRKQGSPRQSRPDARVSELSVVQSWVDTIGEALASPGLKTLDRNRKFAGCMTEESSTWLAHHQAASKKRLERRCARLVRLRQLPVKPLQGESKVGQQEPIELLLESSRDRQSFRQPPRTPEGAVPQVVLLELEGLVAERYQRSFWDANDAQTFGVNLDELKAHLKHLARRFIICALCSSSRKNAGELLAKLAERSVEFDAAYLLPSRANRRPGSPAISRAALLQICAGLGVEEDAILQRVCYFARTVWLNNATIYLCRAIAGVMLVGVLELEHEEIERRDGLRLLASPSRLRPHFRILLPLGCLSIMVPHPRCEIPAILE